MTRDIEKIKRNDPNWKDNCFNGELGNEGEYYVKDDWDDSILDHNKPPTSQPGLWCQWRLRPIRFTDKDKEEFEAILIWDHGEKFYHYTEWLKYLIENFFKPSGYVLEGITLGVGEDSSEATYIVTQENEVSTYDGLTENTVSEIKEKFAGNEEIISTLNLIELTPDQIKNNFDEIRDFDAYDYLHF